MNMESPRPSFVPSSERANTRWMSESPLVMHEFESAIVKKNFLGFQERKVKYEAFVSNHGKTLNLGTFKTGDEAREAVIKYKIKCFIELCASLGLDPSEGKVYEDNYIAFPSGEILNLHGKEMIGAVDRCGYRHLIVNKKNVNVHRIIAKLFVENPNGYNNVNHKNGIKTDNRSENLEWCTRSYNVIHAYRTGLERKRFGEESANHKLTKEDVIYIKSVCKPRDKENGYAALARKYNVDRTTISAIANGETWRHVQ